MSDDDGDYGDGDRENKSKKGRNPPGNPSENDHNN